MSGNHRPKRAVQFDGDYSLIEKQLEKDQQKHKRKVVTNELFCMLKHVKQKYTGKKDLYDYHCAIPRENFITFINPKWHESNKLVDECRFDSSSPEFNTLKSKYETFANVFFDISTREKGFRHRVQPGSSPPEPIAFITGLDRWTWRLFVGVDRDDTSLNFQIVDELMEMFHLMSTDDISALHQQRKSWKHEYIENRNDKDVSHAWIVVDDTYWLVSEDFDLPWQIPTRYHWHNSKAVRPSDTINISEASQCGRLVGANASLYQLNLDYKVYVPLGIDLHHNIIGTKNPPANWWLDWFYNDFTWIQRPYKLAVVPLRHVGNHLIMIFTSHFIRQYSNEHANSIVVPQHSYICSLSGELRPVDLTVTEGNSVEIAEKRRNIVQKQLNQRPCNFVCTNLSSSTRRPGVGNHGFMANSTCRDPYFQLVKQQIGKNQSHVVRAASCIYKHCFLVAQKHLRIKDIVEKHFAIMKVAEQNGDRELLELGKQQYIFPVEFVYDAVQGRPNAIECACLTHCYTETSKGTVNIEIEAVEVRPSRETAYNLETLNDDLDAITIVNRTHTGFTPYMDTVRWLKQFSHIEKSQLNPAFLPKKRATRQQHRDSDDSFDEFSTWAVSSDSDNEFFQTE